MVSKGEKKELFSRIKSFVMAYLNVPNPFAYCMKKTPFFHVEINADYWHEFVYSG